MWPRLPRLAAASALGRCNSLPPSRFSSVPASPLDGCGVPSRVRRCPRLGERWSEPAGPPPASPCLASPLSRSGETKQRKKTSAWTPSSPWTPHVSLTLVDHALATLDKWRRNPLDYVFAYRKRISLRAQPRMRFRFWKTYFLLIRFLFFCPGPV